MLLYFYFLFCFREVNNSLLANFQTSLYCPFILSIHGSFTVFNVHYTVQPCFGCECWLKTTGEFSLFGIVVSDKVHMCPATFIVYLSTQEPYPRPPFQADLGTDGELCLTIARLSSHSSNELDFRVNLSQTQAQSPSVERP